ncbi:putative membrane protein [Campylobacter sp. RM5004]|uniref:superinfection exclusion B family protein n=1 Tax=Campylobacter sp. RM5004 TaxID=1660078 RepID=UPI001EFB17F9|nr:superinfection exclusion B family protein [Campylobacter sp. RM5004]ULO00743.1 putative membrane protein [Campylobacter sp. RM5004]
MNFDLSEFLKYFKSLFSVAFAVLIAGVILLSFEDFLGKFLGIEELLNNYKGILGLAVFLSFIIVLAKAFEQIVVFYKDIKKKRDLQNKYNNKKSAYKNTLINLKLDEKMLLMEFLCDETGMIRIDFDFNRYDGIDRVVTFLTTRKIIYLACNEYISGIYKIDKLYFEIMQENPKEIFYEDEFKEYFIEEKES